HNHSPSVIPFGVTGVPLRPLYHMSAFLWEGVPVFDIRRAAGGASDMLVRDPALGRALAQTLGSHTAALMRGHGAVVVGPSLPHAVFRSVYLEMNAKLQAQAMAQSAGVIETVGEGVTRFKKGDRVYVVRTTTQLSGGYAELALCDAPMVHTLPANVSFSQGAAVSVPYGTAYRGLHHKAHARPGETLL